jgi:hypothetical protein
VRSEMLEALHLKGLLFYAFEQDWKACDRLCGLVVRVLGYRFGGPGSIPGLERGPLNLANTTEELLDRKVAAPV